MPYIRALVDHDSERGLSFVASGPQEARDGMSLRMDRFLLANYRANPVFLWAHQYDTIPLGRMDVDIVDGALRSTPTKWRKAPFPTEVKQAYEDGILHAVSIGWDNVTAGTARRRGYADVPANAKDDDVYHELLDISAVPVPGDPTALVERQRTALAALVREMVADGALAPDVAVVDYDTDTDVESPENATEAPQNERGAILGHDTPKADPFAKWDGPAAVKAAKGEAELRRMHAWVDSEGDPESKGSYKLPHHEADGKVNWFGVAAAMGAVNGAQGGVDIPPGDVAGVRSHLARHYKAFGKKPPEPRSADDSEARMETDTEDNGAGEPSREQWPDVAAAMVRVLDPASDDDDKTRRRRYNALLPAYRRCGKVPPEFMGGDDLRALGDDEWRGLWLEGEIRAGKKLSTRNTELVQQAYDMTGRAHELLGELLDASAPQEPEDDMPVKANAKRDEVDPTIAELAHMRALFGDQ